MSFENFSKNESKETFSRQEGLKNLTKEEIKNYKKPESKEKAENIMESISETEKEVVEKTVDKFPERAKKEITQAVKTNIDLLKSLGQGLKEKIDWKKTNKKKLVALGIYAMGAFMGTALEASESDSENPFEAEDTIDSDFVKATIFGHLEDFNQLEGLNQEGGSIFIEMAVDLAEKMLEQEKGNKQDYDIAVKEMAKFTKWCQNENVDLGQYKYGLQEIIDDFVQEDKGDSLESPEQTAEGDFGGESIGITLPEKFDLEFSDQYSEFEQAKIQEYYNNKVDLIHELAEQMNDLGEKYRDRANWENFEKEVKKTIQNEIDELNKLEKDVEGSKVEVKVTSLGLDKTAIEKKAHLMLNFIEQTKASIRTPFEMLDDEI